MAVAVAASRMAAGVVSFFALATSWSTAVSLASGTSVHMASARSERTWGALPIADDSNND